MKPSSFVTTNRLLVLVGPGALQAVTTAESSGYFLAICGACRGFLNGTTFAYDLYVNLCRVAVRVYSGKTLFS